MPTLIFGSPLIPMPAFPPPSSIEFTAIDLVAVSESIFTGQQQIQNWNASRMEWSVQMPPLTHKQAQPFIAWLLGVQGMAGVFQLGDPLAVNPQGTGAGSLTVSGGGQTGYTLNVNGGSGSGCLLPGDYIQIGFRLYRNLGTYNGGSAALTIWPQLRESPLNGTGIIVTGTQGLFRLKANQRKWSVTDARVYGVQFEIREAL